jgi:hypothetical protein
MLIAELCTVSYLKALAVLYQALDDVLPTLARCFHALNLCMRERLSCLRVYQVAIVSALIEGACDARVNMTL